MSWNIGSIITTSVAPVSGGTSAIQTLTFGGTITGGIFKLQRQGHSTPAIHWSSVNATLVANIQTALDRLDTIGAGNTLVAVGTMTAGIGTITVTFQGKFINAQMDDMVVVNQLQGTSPTLSNATTTAGVNADGRGYSTPGSLCVRQDTGALYVNMGTDILNPNWVAVP